MTTNIYYHLNSINQKHNNLLQINKTPDELLDVEHKKQLDFYKEKALDYISKVLNQPIEEIRENKKEIINLGILLAKEESLKELKDIYNKHHQNPDEKNNQEIIDKMIITQIEIQGVEKKLGLQPKNEIINGKKIEDENDETKKNIKEEKTEVNTDNLVHAVIVDAKLKGNVKADYLEDTPLNELGERQASLVPDVVAEDVSKMHEKMDNALNLKTKENQAKDLPPINMIKKPNINNLSKEITDKIKERVNKFQLAQERTVTTLNKQEDPVATIPFTLAIQPGVLNKDGVLNKMGSIRQKSLKQNIAELNNFGAFVTKTPLVPK